MTDLWYDEAGAGAPVVLLHQGVVDARIWEPLVPLLAEHYRVIRYDQCGYGRSPMWTDPYSPIHDLLAVMDAAGAAEAALVGASRGGRIALQAALAAPDRVSALVLVGSGVSGRPLQIEATPEQERRWEEVEARGDVGGMAEIDLEIWAPLGADDELLAMFVENAEASNAEDPAVEEPAAGRLREISAPTLVVTGARDVAAINELGDVLAREISDARSAVIDQADHMVQWRAPQELSHLIVSFLG